MTNKHTINVAGRPARDDLEVPLDNEPDTPLHHSYRGPSAASWKNRLVLYAQVLLVFLLIAAAGVWFFIDVEDLRHSRRSGRVGMQSDESFPYNFLRVSEDSMPRSRALSRAESVGGYVEEVEEFRQRVVPANERLVRNADPQAAPSQVVSSEPQRDTKIVFLLPDCCEQPSLDDEQLGACHQHLMSSCNALADKACYIEASKQGPCNLDLNLSHGSSYHTSYLSGLRRAVPHLKELGWENVQIHPSLGQSQLDAMPCAPNSSSIHQAAEAVKSARIVVAQLSDVPEVIGHNEDARIIVVDTSKSSVLANDPNWDAANVAQIWRAQVLTDKLAQNGPLLNGSANLAAIAGAMEEDDFQVIREHPLSSSVLGKTVAILSHAHRYRFPLDCGGDLEHIRFVGAFAQNSSHWATPKLRDRKIDVAFMPPLTPTETMSGVSSSAQKLIAAQRNSLTKVLKGMQEEHPELDIQVTSSNSGSYSEYLQQLQSTKILITLGGIEEWNEQDFDAILSGCLLLKVNPDSYKTFPDLFDPSQYVLETDALFSQLSETLLHSLQNLEQAQAMADRSMNQLLQMSDVKRYSKAIEEQLLLATQGAFSALHVESQ